MFSDYFQCFLCLISAIRPAHCTVNNPSLVLLGHCGCLRSMYFVSTSRLASEKSTGPLSLPMVKPTSSVYIVPDIKAQSLKVKDKKSLLRSCPFSEV